MSRNIVLLVLDTVRKDTFDEYATRLQRRADISYDRCYAASHYTLPSHASMLTGVLPHRHGVHSKNTSYRHLDIADTVFSDLPHQRLGVSANTGFLSHELGFGSFFDQYTTLNGETAWFPDGINISDFLDKTTEEGLNKYLTYLNEANKNGVLYQSIANGFMAKLNSTLQGTPFPRIRDYGANSVFDKAVDVVSQTKEEFFLFINVLEAHGPLESVRGWDSTVPNRWYSGKEDSWAVCDGPADDYTEYLENYRNVYEAAVDYLDRRVSRFVDTVQERTQGETTFVITADHGEALQYPTENSFGHRELSTPVLHVPCLIINAPRNATESTDELVSQLSFPDLLTGIANENVPDISQSAVPAEKLGVYYCPSDRKDFWTRGVRAVYTEDILYRWDSLGNASQYSVSTSSEELLAEKDVPTEYSEAFFAKTFDEIVSTETAQSDAVASRLQSLGYL